MRNWLRPVGISDDLECVLIVRLASEIVRVTGEWLEAYCRATFSDSGDLRLIVTRMSDGEIIFNIDEQGLDLWRGESASHFVRPKWGIYRSILDWDNLRSDEETVRFANFSVSEVML